jgi:hypothetical protein
MNSEKQFIYFESRDLEIKSLVLNNGKKCELFLPENPKNREHFVSNECEYTPVGWTKIDDGWYPLAYKVVRTNLTSLGLRTNPNTMTFPIGEWVMLPDDKVTVGNTHWSGWGGIWSALRIGSAKTIHDYCLYEKKDEKFNTRTFLTAIYRPLFANGYRLKSQGVMLLEEIL